MAWDCVYIFPLVNTTLSLIQLDFSMDSWKFPETGSSIMGDHKQTSLYDGQTSLDIITPSATISLIMERKE